MAIVGQDTPFTIFDDDKVKPYLDAIEGDSRAPAPGTDMLSTMTDPDLQDDREGPSRQSGAEVNVNIESMEH